jgi:endoglucanase
MDEVGLMVTGITDKGFLHFTNLGGVDARILPGQEVIVHGTEDLVGIIGAKPPHLIDESEANKAPKIADLSIDLGMTAERVKKLVHVGDNVSYRHYPMYLNKNGYSSKSLDDRAGVAAMIETLKELKKLEFNSEVIAAATVQEEVGVRGAIVGAFDIQPDLAIVIDAGHGDIPDASKEDVYTLGKGPAIGVGPVLNQALTKFLFSVAKECQIPYQIDVEEGSTGTEAWATQISGRGIPTLLVSIPVRYMHTTVETLDINDVSNTARLISRFIARISNRLEEFICC